jgi:hypothetical protein
LVRRRVKLILKFRNESLEVLDDEIENTQVPKYSFPIQSSSEVISSKNSIVSKNEKIKQVPLRTSKSTLKNNNIIPKKNTSSSNVFDRLNSIKLSRLNTNIVPDPGLLKSAGLTETTSNSKLDIYKTSKSKPKMSNQIINKISGPINLKSITQSAKTKK